MDGQWHTRTPEDAAALMAGYNRLWWITGGWALQTFTGVERAHADCDVCVLRNDVVTLAAHLADREARAAEDGRLGAFDPGRLSANCHQVWVRGRESEAWEYDVLLAPGDDHTWVYRRDARVTLPMTEALWQRGGIRYLQPEIQLLYKAKALRAKDDEDFVTTLPHLGHARRRWLAAALELTLPSHPWLDRLS